MKFQTIILRFRDLVTENGITIVKHIEVIQEKGHVWWGWWNKGCEQTPYDEFSVLRGRIKGTTLFLMDSGQEKLYKAICSDLKYSQSEKTETPEPEYTPDYYNTQSYFAWFKFERIEECDINELRNYTYVRVDSLFIEKRSNYDKFYGKRIYDIGELIQQNRTVWFVRNYDEKNDKDYEIKLLNAHIVEPHDFSDKYFETGSDTLLWLSDLHFGRNDVFKVKKENRTDITLTEHIKNAYGRFDKLGGLIITGDIISCGQNEGFDKAKALIKDFNRNLIRELTSENIIFCPGNHDLKRKDIELKKGVPEKVSNNPESIEGYKDFYYSVHNLNPNQFLACGRRLLMSTGRTVEIVALNSLILQQYKDFEGHGFLSMEQLQYVADKMGWEENKQTNSIRIAVMHHHFMPTCLVEQVEVKKPSSVVYDAERLMQWLSKYNFKLLLHGHKHQTFVSRVGRVDNHSLTKIEESNWNDIYVIGMGGTGAINCENKFATMNFQTDKIEVNFFRIFSDNTEADKCVQTVCIPI